MDRKNLTLKLMIEEIHIKDLGVIQEAVLKFGSGLTVVTGETGAGKTMVLTALGLLLGDRSDSGTIRAGSSQTVVSGSWQLPETHAVLARAEEAGAMVEQGQLLLSRTVSTDGRSKAVAGGRQVPIGLLNEIGQELVVVHGQADQIRLKSPAAQRMALDRFAGTEHLNLLDQYSLAYKAWKDAVSQLDDAKSGTANLERERAELSDNLDFLLKLKAKPGEDVELAELAQRLTHTEQLREAVGLAHDALLSDDFDSSDALTQIGKARKALESAVGYDSSLDEKVETLRELIAQLNEVAADLSGYLASMESDNGMSLDQIQERRSEISLAMKRFGPTLTEVLEYQEKAQARLLQLDGGSQSIDSLEALVNETRTNLGLLADKVSANRIKAAADLAQRVTAELKSLAMANSKLHVQVLKSEIGPNGQDDVSLLLESYEGAEPRPIGKSASGGELSRIMLALEVILSESESASTFIFDEVDAGVGGAAAIEVGRRLAGLAKNAQVIVVTHLAQVAAFADKHLTVVKSSSAGFTASDVQDLSGDQRAAELARMLSGLQESDSAREHALELLALAKS